MDTESPANPERPRRWHPQFSLKMMFLLTALAAVLLSWWRVKQNIRDMEAREHSSATYYREAGLGLKTVMIDIDSDVIVDDRLLADLISRAAQSGPVELLIIDAGWKNRPGSIAFVPRVELTPSAWHYIEGLDLDSICICGPFDDAIIGQLEKLASLKELTIEPCGTHISLKGEERLRKALPRCKTEIHEHSSYPCGY